MLTSLLNLSIILGVVVFALIITGAVLVVRAIVKAIKKRCKH